MISDDVGRELHDRTTRGLPLTAAERSDLEGWYEAQDMAEMGILGGTESPPDLAALQARVDGALEQLRPTIQRIQELSQQNETLREEVRDLRRQIVQLLPSEAA